jgi:signal transduction histidine kinase/DNA-binding NarL/FixJ family response regulator
MKYLELAKKIENMLIYIGQERGTSAIYSVSKGEFPNSKQLMQSKRKMFDASIRQFKNFINKNPEYYPEVKNIVAELNKLPEIRKNIDNFKDNYIKNEFFNYYTVLSSSLMNTEGKILKRFPAELKPFYIQKFQFEKMIDYSGVIRGFGAYYITADQPITEKEYENILLKYFHDSNILLTEVLKNKKTKALYQSKKYLKTEKQIKEIIYYLQQANQEYYLTGEFNGYPIDSLDYFNIFTNRISYFKKTVESIDKDIQTKLNQIVAKSIKTRNINIAIFLIAILILIIGYYLNRAILRHIKSLSNLLTSLTPVTGKEVSIDITSPQGMNEALQIVDEAIKITQESVRRAEEATKAKSLFLANMSHEIRTPLNGILGFLELLNTTELTTEQLDYVNTISQSAKNLLQIVNNILDVSKIESNKVSLEIIDFKALDEFENTIELFGTPAAQKNIELTTQISPDLPSVIKGDILKIKEILTNLLSNAIKFTPNNGHINVKIQLQEIIDNKAKIYFEIKDSGIGMSEEQKEKVFDAFSQADESVTRKYGGTGLGLTIVKSYIEMMGGEIQIESEINRGTKFYFDIMFDITDPKPKYAKNIFANKEVAILNTNIESVRKETTLEYLTYFGIEKVGINSAEEICKLNQTEKFDAAIVFYDESNKQSVESLNEINIPKIYIASYAKKEEINKLNYESVIFDPNMPTKIFKAIDGLNEYTPKTSATKTEQPEHKDIYSLKALIAEDNPINQKLLQTTLKGLGIESDLANNGLEAFNKYTMHPDKYDVIFMDVQMPVMDGLEATQEILEFEQEEETPHTPIIAVTANVLKGDRERFMGAGMDEYISKPISKDALLKILERVAHGDFSKHYIEAENTEVQIKTEQQTTNNTVKGDSDNEPKVILVTKSLFLSSYIQHIIDTVVTAESIESLTKVLSKTRNAIIMLDEHFANRDDLRTLIQSIKKLKPEKIIFLGDEPIENADITVQDLKPETIQNAIKG